MRIIADTHTHTLMSGHAHSTLLENITEAKRKGLKFLAVTDHTGIMPDAPSETYFACMWSTIPDEHNGLYLLRGCEANILDEIGKMDISDRMLGRLEWVIASIHGVLTQPMDVRQCTKLWRNIAENPNVDVIGHCGEEKFKFDYEEVIPAFAQYGKIVEINSSSFKNRPSCKDNCMKIARLCEEYGVPLVVSSDAHFAADVGNVDRAVLLLQQYGISEETILNADIKRFSEKVRGITGRKFEI